MHGFYQLPPPPPPDPPPETPPPLLPDPPPDELCRGAEDMALAALLSVRSIACHMVAAVNTSRPLYHSGGSIAMFSNLFTHLSDTPST